MSHIRVVSLLLAGLALGACDEYRHSPTAPPTMAGVAGEYQVVRFKSFSGANTAVDVLAKGGAVQLTLRENGSTAGTAHLPEGTVPGQPGQDASLEGTWRLEDREFVRLEQTADTPLRAARYLVRGNQLLGSARVGAVMYEISLERR